MINIHLMYNVFNNTQQISSNLNVSIFQILLLNFILCCQFVHYNIAKINI